MTSAPRRPSRLREGHPFLNPFWVFGGTVAAFLATLALLTAQLTTGHDSAVGRLTAVARTSPASGGGVLSTRTSGASAAPSSAAAGGPAVPATPLVSRTSGLVLEGSDDG